MDTLKKLVDFMREYPPWVYAVVLAAFAVAFTALVFGRSRPSGEVRVFANHSELLEDSRLTDVLKKSAQFDIIAFSANVLKQYRTEVTQAVNNGAQIRIAILDPGKAIAADYDRFAILVGETPAIKRDEARQLAQFVMELQKDRFSQGPGSIDLRFIRKQPLLYNLWLSKGLDGSQCGHLSVYFYHGFQDSPSFRSCRANSPLLTNMAKEFSRMWQEAFSEPSATIDASNSSPVGAAHSAPVDSGQPSHM